MDFLFVDIVRDKENGSQRSQSQTFHLDEISFNDDDDVKKYLNLITNFSLQVMLAFWIIQAGFQHQTLQFKKSCMIVVT